LNKVNRAQFFSIDLLFASLIFLTIIISTAFLWEYVVEKNYLSDKEMDLTILARDISSKLLISNDDASLVIEPWVLDQQKIDNFYNLNYNVSKQKLGLLGPGYNYNIAINRWTGSNYTHYYSLGSSREDSEFIVVSERFAVLNNEWMKVTLTLWNDE